MGKYLQHNQAAFQFARPGATDYSTKKGGYKPGAIGAIGLSPKRRGE
jgi:hypothetical protein